MESKWMLYTKRAEFEKISARFGISPVLARIIVNRDIEENEFEKYLNNDIDRLYSPKLLKGVDKADEILSEEMAKGNKIRVVGDYDIDGVCSSYILAKALKYFGANVDVRIPDRVKDGYGINDNIIREAKEEGISLIITCDNGIAAHSQMELAKSLGIKVIITDHHEVYQENEKDFLPYALVVINPKRSDCEYPFKDICGALVAYKLMGYMYEKRHVGEKIYNNEELSDLFEVAAIATVGDVMPLRDENRILVKNGLMRLTNTKNRGLQALMKATNMWGKNLSAYHVGFVLGPCLNAGGRLENALIALNMFMSEDEETAAFFANRLKELNDERKDLTAENVKRAIEKAQDYERDDILVIYLDNCHESIAGIIAGRVRETLGKPTIILTDAHGERDMVKGSGRSIESYNMFNELYKVKDIFTKFGGHHMAAGMSLLKDNVDEFRKRLNANSELCEEDFVQKIWIDVALPFSYLSMDFADELGKLEPFGNKNEKPKFARKDIKIISKNVLGKNRNVVKMLLEDTDGTRVEGVSFCDGDEFLEELGDKNVIDIIYYPDINEYGGKKTLQIVINSYKIRE